MYLVIRGWRLEEGQRRDQDDGDPTCGPRRRMSPTLDAVSIPSISNCKPIRKPAVRDLAMLPTQ